MLPKRCTLLGHKQVTNMETESMLHLVVLKGDSSRVSVTFLLLLFRINQCPLQLNAGEGRKMTDRSTIKYIYMQQLFLSSYKTIPPIHLPLPFALSLLSLSSTSYIYSSSSSSSSSSSTSTSSSSSTSSTSSISFLFLD